MGRASQLFWVLYAEKMPTMDESRHHYTHLDILSGINRRKIKKLRRKFKNKA